MALVHEGLNAEVERLKIFAKKCRIEILGKEIRTFDKYTEWEFGDFEEFLKKKKKKIKWFTRTNGNLTKSSHYLKDE